MSGTREGALKRIALLKEKGFDFKQNAINARLGKIGTGGFASEKVGKDGLTGRERAKLAGQKRQSSRYKKDGE